jgi:tetratricopeptide (TPR) repeat protein
MVVGVIGARIFLDKKNNAEVTAAKRDGDDLKMQLNEISARELINKASNLGELDAAEKLIASLDERGKNRLTPYVSLKRARFWFSEGESYLKKAVEIDTAVGGDDDKPIHPLTQKMLDQAFVYWEKARKEAEKMTGENEDNDFKFHLDYLKGEVYYRFLQYLSDRETAREMFNQCVTYYKHALRSRPGDINTVVNIELLIKNERDLAGGGDDPKSRKKQMLNSKKFGIGSSSGN